MRDLHDEDLLFDMAGPIGGQQRLRMLFLVAAAHALAVGGDAWSPWRATSLRRLFALLDTALRSSRRLAPAAGAARSSNIATRRARACATPV